MIVGLYTRVSTLEQAEHGYSISEQEARLKSFTEAMGWTVYQTYTDAGFSGGTTNRPALQRLIADVKAGRLEKVVVYKLDRLSRSQKDTLQLIEDIFLRNKVDFVSLTENFDTSTPFGKAMVGILAVFAQLEREQIKERMSMGRTARAKSGKYVGSIPPFGYDLHNSQLVVNPFEKLQIETIFREYCKGVSPFSISQKLNASGLVPKTGKWEKSTIRTILQNRVYLGEVQLNGTWYEGSHEAIIDPDTFSKAQAVKSRKHTEHELYNRRLGRASSFLSGYLVCGYCGAKYQKITTYGNTSKGKVKYRYYSCTSRQKKSPDQVRDPNCRNKIWRMEELDEIIFSEIKKLAIDPEYLKTATAGQQENNRTEIIQQELGKIEAQISRLLDLYTVDGIPLDSLQSRIRTASEQKEKLEAELEALTRADEKRLSQAQALQIIKSFDQIIAREDYDEIRNVIGTLIENIILEGSDITINWAFS